MESRLWGTWGDIKGNDIWIIEKEKIEWIIKSVTRQSNGIGKGTLEKGKMVNKIGMESGGEERV